MGSWLEYRCPGCSFKARVGGPEEFFLDRGGERRPHGHPEAESLEAAERGVDGFWMSLWCTGCTELKRVVTMEFEAPVEPLDAWAGRGTPRPGYPVDAEKCEECGSDLLDEIPGMPAPCPACAQARLAGGRRQPAS